MNFKKMFLPVLTIMAVLGMAAIPAVAGHHESGQPGAAGKTCPMGGGYKKGGCDKGGMSCAKPGSCDKQGGHGKGDCGSEGASGCPIVAKFCKKSCWILKHKTELGLTDEQVATIQSLQLEVKKSSIRGAAEMKVFMLEMENRLSQDSIDVEAIESMIDSGMANMAIGAKAAVKAYADLKAVATPEQKAKAKELMAADQIGCEHKG